MPDLGKYGVEVLSAYGFSIVLLAGLVWVSWRSARASAARLDAAEDQTRG